MSPRVLAYVRDGSRHLRVVHVPDGYARSIARSQGIELVEVEPTDRLAVEQRIHDAMGHAAWVSVADGYVERRAIERALLGGEGVTRPADEAAVGSLDSYRQLVAWCDAHDVCDPYGLMPATDSRPAYVELRAAEWERVVPAGATVRRAGLHGTAAVVDGVEVITYGATERVLPPADEATDGPVEAA